MIHTNNQLFEDFLRDVHAEQYHGTDDDMSDDFDNWLSNLEVDEMISLGNRAMEKAE